MNALNRLLVLLFSVAMLFACGGGGSDDTLISTKTLPDVPRARVLAVNSTPVVMQVQLPFNDGEAFACTQNSNGDTSHFYDNTRYDIDLGLPNGTLVVAAADGTMRRVSNPGGFGIYAKVEHGNGYWTIYGHLSGYIAQDGDQVVAGQPIAYSGNTGFSVGDGGGYHLHFGVHSGLSTGDSEPMKVYAYNRNTDVLGVFQTGAPGQSTFVCGIPGGHSYESRPIGAVFGEFHCEAVSSGGVICWKGNPVDCVDGNSHVWYHKNDEGAYLSESNSSTWQKCIQTTVSTNIFAYLDGGYGVGGVGPGTETEATDNPIPNLPDFAGTKSWLETPWGTEAYRYGYDETIKMKGRFENKGDGPCQSGEPDGIVLHAYLSFGYKEDPHSGDRAWQRVASDTISCSSLKPGDTHTDTESLIIRNYITSPGIGNIVWCGDHPQNDHNNGGDHVEKHESNNCTTEAVFEVTADPIVNLPDTDIITSLIEVKGGATVLAAGGLTNLKMAIRNIGTLTPPAGDFRSSYRFCGPLPSTTCTQVADDGSEASNLTPGRDLWEETQVPVRIPSTLGTYLLTGCADYQGNVNQTKTTTAPRGLSKWSMPSLTSSSRLWDCVKERSSSPVPGSTLGVRSPISALDLPLLPCVSPTTSTLMNTETMTTLMLLSCVWVVPRRKKSKTTTSSSATEAPVPTGAVLTTRDQSVSRMKAITAPL